MPRYLTPSRWNSVMRQAQQARRQTIDKFNREVRAYEQKVNQAINNYNREAHAYNARVRANQQRLKNEIARLSRQTTTSRFVTFRISVNAVHTAYERLERAADAGRFDAQYSEILDLSEREAANNVGLMNALLGDTQIVDNPAPNSLESPLTLILQMISGELGDRWRGALFSLNPHNPDAARHFCTSAREIIARILDVRASDDMVASGMPDCDRTPQEKTPTRRAKIRYLLYQKGMSHTDLEGFVESDMNNVIDLFQVFNEGTHGYAGTFDFAQLLAIRRRVEDGIMFLSRIVG